MLSLVPVQLGLEPTATTKPPIVERVRVQAMSSWNALLIGIVTGFAMSAGTLIFNKLASRMKWR